MKKIIAMFFLAITVLSLSACNGKQIGVFENKNKVDYTKIGDYGDIKLPLDNKATKISILVSSNFQNGNDLAVIRRLREITGINIQLIPVSVANIKDKVKLLVASNQIPDIIGSGFDNPDMINDFAVQGAFASINQYIDKLPNMKKILDMPGNQWYAKSFEATDGNLYLFPRYDCSREVNHGFLYRKDIFDKNGIKEWKNKDEFYLALKKLKELYPESIPYVSKSQATIFNQWSTSWGLNAPGVYYNESDKLWEISAIDPKYKEMLDFMRKLYVEKLMDPEFLTCTQANWTTKMTKQEQSFVTFDWIGRLDMFYEQAKDEVPQYDLRYGYPVGPTGNVTSLRNISHGSVVANNKNQELSFKLLDYLISPSGAQLTTMGIEGETYTLDQNGKAKYLGFPEGKILGINDLEDKYGLFLEGIYKRMDRRSVYFNFTPKEQQAQDKIINENRFEPADPLIVYTSDEKTIMGEYTAKFQKAADEFSTKYVLGVETGDAAWNAWLEKAKTLNVDKMIVIQNEAQKRYDNKQTN